MLAEGTTAFATIVALIGQFRAEKQGDDRASYEEFIEWLLRDNHKEIKSLIESNQRTVVSIKAILNQSYEDIVNKIYIMDKRLALIASRMEGFNELANALSPDAVLSEQAMDILTQFERSGASKLLVVETMVGMSLLFIDSKSRDNRAIEIADERFIVDDLSILVEVGLLRHQYNFQGKDLYVYTKAASDLVKASQRLD